MPRTDELIDRLTGELTPVRRGPAAARAAALVGAALIASVILMLVWMGLRPDMAEAAGGYAFWVKAAYPALVAAAGLYALARLAVPSFGGGGRIALALIPAAVVAGLAALELSRADAGEATRMWMGGSSSVCPWRILALSAPMLAAAMLVLRGLAPMRPTLTGFAAGLAAGGVGAVVYAMHCGETSMPFLLLWYSTGVLLSGLAGAVLGRLLLRW